MNIHCFTFNAFLENTYVIYSDNGSSIIIDAGCSNPKEESSLQNFIVEKNLTVVSHLLTHSHIDHILGSSFIYKQYGLKPQLHLLESQIYNSGPIIAQMYDIIYEPGPMPEFSIVENQFLQFESMARVKPLLVSGHSPGSICYYFEEFAFLIAGDTLFEGSIGRTDLPGGNHDELIKNIQRKLLSLPNETKVYPGHGPMTTIGQEKLTNPFL
jgi:glyoxylase-like metal-dependent hydrolase (beta-lactamase superfamily II)